MSEQVYTLTIWWSDKTSAVRTYPTAQLRNQAFEKLKHDRRVTDMEKGTE